MTALPLASDMDHEDPTQIVQEWLHTVAQHSLLVFHLASGNYESAYQLASAPGLAQGDLADLTLPDRIEAAVRSGHRQAAVDLLSHLEDRAHQLAPEVRGGLLARSRALVAEGGGAERHYKEAVRELSRARSPIQAARTRLLYGEWLRRRRRRVVARQELQAALEVFESVGAATFTARARAECAATTERARSRSGAAPEQLTPQEARIVEMAAAGATNAEIAMKLFISSHTVSHHLRNAFRKLDVSSRRQLSLVTPGRANGSVQDHA